MGGYGGLGSPRFLVYLLTQLVGAMPAALTTGIIGCSKKPFEPRNEWIKLLEVGKVLEMPNGWELGFPGHQGRSRVKGQVPVKVEKKNGPLGTGSSNHVTKPPEAELQRRDGAECGTSNGNADALPPQPIGAGRRYNLNTPSFHLLRGDLPR